MGGSLGRVTIPPKTKKTLFMIPAEKTGGAAHEELPTRQHGTIPGATSTLDGAAEKRTMHDSLLFSLGCVFFNRV